MFPCRSKASPSSSSCLLGITSPRLVYWQPPSPARHSWGWAELCDETRNCSSRGKKNGKLNFYIENGIFSWFLVFCSVPGNSDPGLVFFCFVSVSQCVFFLSLFFCFALRARDIKEFLRICIPACSLLFVHSSHSSSQPKPTQCCDTHQLCCGA